jgi:hypothetical protein
MSRSQEEAALAWAPAAVARDSHVAERWQAALEAEGIEAEVRIEDALRAVPGSSPLPGYLPPSPPFAFAVYVPAERVPEARRVLIDHGWDGRYGEQADEATPIPGRSVVVGAILALLAGAAVVLLRVLG